MASASSTLAKAGTAGDDGTAPIWATSLRRLTGRSGQISRISVRSYRPAMTFLGGRAAFSKLVRMVEMGFMGVEGPTNGACWSCGWLADSSAGRADRGDVDRGRIAGLPVGQRVDHVDVDEAVAFPEGPGGLVGAVAGGAVQGFGLHDADPVGAQVVQDVAEQPGSVPAAAAGRVDGYPQDLRAAG